METPRAASLWKSTWVAVALLMLLAPAAAFAQCPVLFNTLPPGAATTSAGTILGILNETRERLGVRLDQPSPLNQGRFVDGFRIANATEQGVLFGGCGTLETFAGSIHVQAISRVPANFTGPADNPNLGIGPISGTFTIKTASGRIHGRLDGVLDFVPTNTSVTLCAGQNCPFVTASGSWKTSDKAGSFAGLALVPFEYPGLGWVYLDATAQGSTPGFLFNSASPYAGYYPLVPLVPGNSGDFNADGLPEAKFIINLFE